MKIEWNNWFGTYRKNSGGASTTEAEGEIAISMLGNSGGTWTCTDGGKHIKTMVAHGHVVNTHEAYETKLNESPRSPNGDSQSGLNFVEMNVGYFLTRQEFI